MDARRPLEPAMKVVGFDVPGKSPSPVMHSALTDWDDTNRSSSPAPVRVPPRLLVVEEPKPAPRQLTRSVSNPISHSGLTSYIGGGQVPGKLPVVGAAEPSSSASVGLRGASLMSTIPPSLPLASSKKAPDSISEHSSDQSSITAATATQDSAAQGDGLPKEGKSQKQMTRAERRAMQEEQRAKKAAAKAQGGKGEQAQDSAPAGTKAAATKAAGAVERSTSATSGKSPRSETPSKLPPPTTTKVLKKAPGPSVKPSEMFAHLPPYRKLDIHELASGNYSAIHPAMLALGLRYAQGKVKGSNARCVAMLNAICQVIRDYSTPEGKSLSRDLQSLVNTQITFLVRCRPLSVSMGNAIRFLKLHVSKIDPATPEHQAKTQLIELISNFIQEKVVVADRALVEHAVNNIHDGDTILIYSYSHVVLEALMCAVGKGRKFQVVVVDSRPQLEGRRALKKLMAAGVPCTYVLLTNAGSVMKQVTSVFLGASAVLSNGTVISAAGTACVAFLAHSSHKPVVVCCETYKFHERVQLDSIIHNELGNPDDLASLEVLKGWQDVSKLELLNLKYDALPKDYVTMVATEFGAIPATSVPVILREYRQDS